MSNTLTRPRTVVAILAAGALIAVGVLLLVGVFASDDATTTGTADVVVAPTSGGSQQARDQMNERRLLHGAPAIAGARPQQTQGLTYEGGVNEGNVTGDTKGDLPESKLGHGAAGYGPGPYVTGRDGSPAAGRFLATPAAPGDGADGYAGLP
jgi:hypothetical protein